MACGWKILGDSAVQMRIFSSATVERFRNLLKISLKIEEKGEKMEKNLKFEEKGENSVEILLNFAVAFYKKSLELNSGSAGTWQALGLAYYFLAKFRPNESAIQLCVDSLMTSLKINSANADCWKSVNQEIFLSLIGLFPAK